MEPPRLIIYKALALLLSLNYFAFRVEVFDREYNENNAHHSDRNCFSNSTLNWESLDKDNAPQAFDFDAVIRIQLIGAAPRQFSKKLQYYPPFRLIHDKSPPDSFDKI